MQSSKSAVPSLRQSWLKLSRTAVFPLFVSIAALLMASSEWRREQRLMQAARPIQAELQTRLQDPQRHREPFLQISIAKKAGGPIASQHQIKDGCILWFGTHLSESKTFHSGIGK